MGPTTESNAITLGDNFHDGAYTQYRLKIGEFKLVTIRQEKIVYLQHLRKCRENSYNEELIKTYVEIADKYCSQPCKADGLPSYGRTLNKMIEHLPICKNPMELNCFTDALKKAKNDIVQNPCVLSDYKAVKATNNMGGDKAIFKLVVDEMVKVKENTWSLTRSQ